MKKFLIIFGSILLFIISCGTMFKLMHWPGAGPLLVIGMFHFATVFIPLFFISRMRENRSGLSITTNLFGLFSTMMIFNGVLFKIMHWPGAGPLIVFGTLIFVVPTLILYCIQQFKEYDRKFSEFWRTVVMGVLVSVFLIFWGTSVSSNILYGYVKVEDATLETNKNLSEFNQFLFTEIQSAQDRDPAFSKSADLIQAKSNTLLGYIEAIKTQLVSFAERVPENEIPNHWDLNSKDNYDIPTHFLCGPYGKGKELHEKLQLFRNELTEEIKGLPLENKEKVVEGLGNLGIQIELNPEHIDGFDNWEDEMFYQQTLVSSLALLTSLQNEVLNAEFKSLKIIYTNPKSGS